MVYNHFDEFDDEEKIIDDTDYSKFYKPEKVAEIKLTDWLNSINYNKKYLMTKENEKKYPQFIINSILSKSRELIFYIDALNNMEISNICHYDFLLNAIPSSKRYIPFNNKKIKKIEDVELVQKYYKVNYDRALSYFKLLDENDIENLRKYFDEGGLNGKIKR